MGAVCGKSTVTKSTANEPVEDVDCDDDLQGEVHMLVCGLDYACDTQSWAGPPPAGNGPLDTKFAFDAMVGLGQACGVTTLKTMWNAECTKEGITAAIHEMGALVGPNDYFIFYYTGHGDRLKGEDAAEGEDEDNCFCTVGPNGCTDDATMQYRQEAWYRDDDFAAAILDSISTDAADSNILVLVDACHSGTICDFTTNPRWAEHEQNAISITGCTDTETSAGTGKGGVFTTSLCKSIQAIQEEKGDDPYYVSNIYNKVLEEYKSVNRPGHEQQITVHGSVIRPTEMVWPLIPKAPYVSPM